MNHLPRDGAQRYFQTAAPGRVCLTGVGADVDVDEFIAGRTLHKRSAESRLPALPAGFNCYVEFEPEVFAGRTLLLRNFVSVAVPFLQTKVHARCRSLEHDAKRYVI